MAFICPLSVSTVTFGMPGNEKSILPQNTKLRILGFSEIKHCIEVKKVHSEGYLVPGYFFNCLVEPEEQLESRPL